jgi:hypothetical protein
MQDENTVPFLSGNFFFCSIAFNVRSFVRSFLSLGCRYAMVWSGMLCYGLVWYGMVD